MRCPCGHAKCAAWMVDPVAAVQGVDLTEVQARLMAGVLTAQAQLAPDERLVVLRVRPRVLIDAVRVEPGAAGVTLAGLVLAGALRGEDPCYDDVLPSVIMDVLGAELVREGTDDGCKN